MRKFLVASAALALSFHALPLAAEDAPIARVPAVTEQDPDPMVKAMFEATRARGARPINLQLITNLAPKMAKAQQVEAYTIRFDMVTPRPYRELTILRTVQN